MKPIMYAIWPAASPPFVYFSPPLTQIMLLSRQARILGHIADRKDREMTTDTAHHLEVVFAGLQVLLLVVNAVLLWKYVKSKAHIESAAIEQAKITARQADIAARQARLGADQL